MRISAAGRPPTGFAETVEVDVPHVETRRTGPWSRACSGAFAELAGCAMVDDGRARATDHGRPEDIRSLIHVRGRWRDPYRRIATFADKILKGVKPADLPTEQSGRIR